MKNTAFYRRQHHRQPPSVSRYAPQSGRRLRFHDPKPVFWTVGTGLSTGATTVSPAQISCAVLSGTACPRNRISSPCWWGVNDIAAQLYGGIDRIPGEFEAVYRQILSQIRASLPDAFLILMEPFAFFPPQGISSVSSLHSPGEPDHPPPGKAVLLRLFAPS